MREWVQALERDRPMAFRSPSEFHRLTLTKRAVDRAVEMKMAHDEHVQQIPYTPTSDTAMKYPMTRRSTYSKMVFPDEVRKAQTE